MGRRMRIVYSKKRKKKIVLNITIFFSIRCCFCACLPYKHTFNDLADALSCLYPFNFIFKFKLRLYFMEMEQ